MAAFEQRDPSFHCIVRALYIFFLKKTARIQQPHMISHFHSRYQKLLGDYEKKRYLSQRNLMPMIALEYFIIESEVAQGKRIELMSQRSMVRVHPSLIFLIQSLVYIEVINLLDAFLLIISNFFQLSKNEKNSFCLSAYKLLT